MNRNIIIEVPTATAFITLIQNHAIASVLLKQGNCTTEHILLLPKYLNLVTLVEKRCGKYVRFTFKDIDTTDYLQCCRLNAETIDFLNISEYITASILLVDKSRATALIDIEITGVPVVVTYKFNNNVWTLIKPGPDQAGCCVPIPADAPFKKLYPNAQQLSIAQSDTDRTLNIKNTQACFNAFNAQDKRIYNSIWRYTMAKDKHTSTPITDEDIVSRTLHLGAGRSKKQPMALIMANFKIYKQDENLFRPAFTFNGHLYTSIIDQTITSRLIVDQDKFLDILRNNPTCTTAQVLFFNINLAKQVSARRAQEQAKPGVY